MTHNENDKTPILINVLKSNVDIKVNNFYEKIGETVTQYSYNDYASLVIFCL